MPFAFEFGSRFHIFHHPQKKRSQRLRIVRMWWKFQDVQVVDTIVLLVIRSYCQFQFSIPKNLLNVFRKGLTVIK